MVCLNLNFFGPQQFVQFGNKLNTFCQGPSPMDASVSSSSPSWGFAGTAKCNNGRGNLKPLRISGTPFLEVVRVLRQWILKVLKVLRSEMERSSTLSLFEKIRYFFHSVSHESPFQEGLTIQVCGINNLFCGCKFVFNIHDLQIK